jgi:hypothetical protein
VLGDHVLTAGFEQESKTVRNRFLPFSKGYYFFSSIDNLEQRIADFALYGNSNTGVATDAEANFTLDVNSFYIQDEWTPTDDLTLTFGVRFDELSNDDPITDNPNFLARRGFVNGENLDGKDITLPRFGFNYTPNDRLTIRGGAGLFGGGTPLIILSNSYAGDGISRTFADFFACFGCTSGPVFDAVAELPDPTAAFRHFQPLIGTSAVADTDAIDPSYEILSTWKYSLGADYVADLSGIGMGDDWLFSADVIFSEVEDGYDIDELRRTVVGMAPDGRPIYDAPGNADYVVTNTGRGSGTVITLAASKAFDTNAGMFDLSLGYTNTDMDELRSYNRFITFETLLMDPITDANNPAVAPSRYEVEHRVTGTLTWQKELFGENMSTIGMVYAGRSGRHFSYVFGSDNGPTFGGHLFADFGSEGDNPGSQLFYVPTGTSDPIITTDAATAAAFPNFLSDLDTFISSTDCLSAHRGSIVTRNNCQTSWTNVFSVRLMQEITISNDFKFDLMLDIENFGNLLNSDWGRVESFTAPSNVAAAIVAIDATGTQYVLTPNISYSSASSPSASDIVPSPLIAALPSVYRIQLGTASSSACDSDSKIAG